MVLGVIVVAGAGGAGAAMMEIDDNDIDGTGPLDEDGTLVSDGDER